MSNKVSPTAGIVLEDCVAEGNGGDGLRVEGNVSVHAKNFKARDNGGKGINIIRNKKPNTVLGWIMSVLGIVAGGLILAYIFGIGR